MNEPRQPPLRAVGEAEEKPNKASGTERLGLPWLEGLDLSSAFPLALTRRVIRRGLRRTGSGRLDLVARGAILMVVSIVAALLLGPRLVAADLPTDPVLIGTSARSRVVADRDYEIVDDAATQLRRDQAGRRSRSVWDLDHARRQEEVRLLRTQLSRLTTFVERQKAPPTPALGPGGAAAEMVLRAVPLRAAISGELSLGAVEAPRDDAWAALVAATQRSTAAAETLLSTLDAALSREVVGERMLLEREQDRGIVVREIGIQPEVERLVDDVSTVPDLSTRQAGLQMELARLFNEAPFQLGADRAEALARWGASLCRTTLTYNAAESEARRQRAQEETPPMRIRVRRGETVLAAGELMSERHFLILKAMERQQGEKMQSRAALGSGAFMLLLCGVIYLFGARGVFRRRISTLDLVFTSLVLMLFMLGLVAAEAAIVPLREVLPDVPRSALFYAVPVAWAAMQVRFVMNAEVAFLLALVTAVLGGVTTEPGMAWTVTALLGSFAGTAGVGRVRSRWQLLLAGAAAGVVGAGAAITFELFRGSAEGADLWILVGASLASGLLSGVLVALLTPLAEWTFGYVTDLRLLSLADLNQPLLKELILRAPGTWHHSMRVARLAEAAAESIGANGLLARVMSLYHDVGKVRDPQYFVENQSGDNPHDRLPAEESAKYLRAHVRNGVQLAQQHRLPRAVAEVIEEHHGDNLMEAFFRKAIIAIPDDAEGAAVDEALFRYGGRPPRSREAALVMLSDQMEAASRDLRQPGEELVARVVDHFLNRAVIGSSLAECDLSMRELESCREALSKALADLVMSPGTDTDFPRDGSSAGSAA